MERFHSSLGSYPQSSSIRRQSRHIDACKDGGLWKVDLVDESASSVFESDLEQSTWWVYLFMFLGKGS